MIRGYLVGLIHSKSMSTSGLDAERDTGRATTLMSMDVDSLATIAEMVHEAWAHTLEVVIGMTLLTRKVGWISPILLISIFGKPCSHLIHM